MIARNEEEETDANKDSLWDETLGTVDTYATALMSQSKTECRTNYHIERGG